MNTSASLSQGDPVKPPKSLMFKLEMTVIVLTVNFALLAAAVIGLSLFFGIHPHDLYAIFHGFCVSVASRTNLPMLVLEIIFGLGAWVSLIIVGVLFMLIL